MYFQNLIYVLNSIRIKIMLCLIFIKFYSNLDLTILKFYCSLDIYLVIYNNELIVINELSI